MRKHRGILTIVALAALVAAVAAAWAVFFPPLPDPEVANRKQLMLWLVTRDLHAETPGLHQRLARRLEEEFRDGVDWDQCGELLSVSQRRRVWENILTLLEPWFLDKADTYAELTPPEQEAYLERQIETIEVWRGAESLQPPPSEASDPQTQPTSLMQHVFSHLKTWKEQAEPDRRDRIERFQAALQMRWLARKMPKLPFGLGG